MYSKTAALASERVRNWASWTRSVLSEAKKLSMGALSRQLPRRLIDGWIPCRSSTARYGPAAYRTPRMPFCLSSDNASLVDCPVPLRDERVHLTRDVAFEAADRLQLGMAFGDPLGDGGLCPGVRPQPADGDDVERSVGRPIVAAVEAVTHRLPRGGWHRAHPAQRCEARLRAQPLGIVASREEQLRGPVPSNRVAGHQLGGEVLDDGADHGIQIGDLVVQLQIAPSQGLEADPIGRLHVTVACQVRPPCRQGPDELHPGHPAQDLPQAIMSFPDRQVACAPG